MKNIVAASLSLVLIAHSCRAAPASYAEFKQLPINEQRDLVADNTSLMHMKFVNWWWHLKVGDKAWQRKEQKRLIEEHGYGALWLFFDEYAGLKKQFMQLDLDRKQKAGMSVADLDKIAPQVFRDEQAVDDQLNEITQLLSTLAITEEGKQMNEHAEKLANGWIQRSLQPGGPMLSQQEIAAMGNARQEMLEEVNRLPRYTLRETQAQIDALPPAFPNIRGLDIPHR